MKRRDLLRGGAAALLPVWARRGFAAAASASPVIEKLPNGATLITLPEPGAAGVIWEAFFRVGMADEGQYTGIRSLLTSCWIGSDTKGRSAPLLLGDLTKLGASVGAACGPDWVELWAASGPDPYEIEKSAQTLFTNLVAGATFSRDAIEKARAEQLRALALRRDDLLNDVLDRAQARAFGDSPYAVGPPGTPETVAAIPWAQAERFYHKWFRPSRAVFVAAGRITADEARRYVAASLGAAGWDGADAPRERLVPLAAAPVGLRDLVLARRAPAVAVAAAYLAPGLDGTGNYATLLVLDALLRGGKSTRLFALRDQPEAGAFPIGYEIRTAIMPGRGQSLWTAFVWGDRPAAEVRDRLTAALREIAQGTRPFTDTEIVRAKMHLQARQGEERQSLKARVWGAGWSEAMGLGASFDTDYSKHVADVTGEAVQRLARTVLGSTPAIVYSRPDHE